MGGFDEIVRCPDRSRTRTRGHERPRHPPTSRVVAADDYDLNRKP